MPQLMSTNSVTESLPSILLMLFDLCHRTESLDEFLRKAGKVDSVLRRTGCGPHLVPCKASMFRGYLTKNRAFLLGLTAWSKGGKGGTAWPSL